MDTLAIIKTLLTTRGLPGWSLVLVANDGTMWSEAKVVTINIKNVNDMAIISYNITPSYCSSGTGTGAISLEIEGQEGDVTVSWSSGDDILSIQSLVAGTYTGNNY